MQGVNIGIGAFFENYKQNKKNAKKMQKKLFFFAKKYYAKFMYKPVRKG